MTTFKPLNASLQHGEYGDSSMTRFMHFLASALILLMVSACGASTDTPESSLTAFYEAVAKNDAKTALEHVSLADIKESEMGVAREKIKMMVGNFHAKAEEKGGIEKVEVLNVATNEEKTEAEVEVQVTFGNGKSEKNTDDMVKEDGEWKISF
ncbi:DUF4878 domain-containing protein [Halomonas elongata]|uniref:DUF4878 domain-containing protein n=1 Tax=Halomonas elongata TaxID=2746 RepID=UPI004033A1C9